jgi:hypothetical protein
MASSVVEQSTGGSVGAVAVGGGLIPALIGVAVDASITTHLKGGFEEQHGSIENAAAAMDKSVTISHRKRTHSLKTFPALHTGVDEGTSEPPLLTPRLLTYPK